MIFIITNQFNYFIHKIIKNFFVLTICLVLFEFLLDKFLLNPLIVLGKEIENLNRSIITIEKNIKIVKNYL